METEESKFREQFIKFMSEQQLKNTESTHVTADSFKRGLQDTIKQITRGYKITMYMYLAVFGIGVILIIVSIFFALTSDKEIVSSIFGGVGALNVFAFFFSKTPIRLQESRSKLAQLQAATFSWFIDIINWNSLLLAAGRNADFDLLKKVSEEQMNSTKETIKLISEATKIDI
jgi:hypothetical protein